MSAGTQTITRPGGFGRIDTVQISREARIAERRHQEAVMGCQPGSVAPAFVVFLSVVVATAITGGVVLARLLAWFEQWMVA